MSDLAPDSARAIARETYIYGTPLVSVYRTMYAYSIDRHSGQYQGPFNTILNIARVFTPDDKAFVTPNADTPYTFSGLDLRAEPVVITVPPMEEGRYFVFQLLDLYTFNFAYIGSRTTGNRGGDYLIAGPSWDGRVPRGIDKVIRSETALVSVVGRTQLFDPEDLDNVKAIQNGYDVRTLSEFASLPTPPLVEHIDWIEPLSPEDARTSLEFFNELAFLLQLAEPPHPDEIALRERMATIGVLPGKPFSPDDLSDELRQALQQGMRDGQADIDARRAALGGKTDTLFGDRAFLHGDYLARATGTEVGIGANSREEAMYPILEQDAEGLPLDGAKHRYALRFPPGGLPPVNAFWSLTMYDLPNQLLVANPIHRYLINSPMLPSLRKDADGGLTIDIQAAPPEAGREANWLPAPQGRFLAFLRYYWPQPALLNGSWQTPSLQRVGDT